MVGDGRRGRFLAGVGRTCGSRASAATGWADPAFGGHGAARQLSKYVLFYESAEDVLATAPRHFAAQRARYESFRDTGQLLLIGTFADARRDGAMAIFATREAAREFAEGDPFVLNGVVRNWDVREWLEVLGA